MKQLLVIAGLLVGQLIYRRRTQLWITTLITAALAVLALLISISCNNKKEEEKNVDEQSEEVQNEMDEAIEQFIRRAFNLQIGIFEAERIKLAIGSAMPMSEPREMEIFGRDLATGVPREMIVDDGSKEGKTISFTLPLAEY